MKISRLPVLTSALAGLICMANTASAQLTLPSDTEDTSREPNTFRSQPSGNITLHLNVVTSDLAHLLSLVLGGVGMLHLLRRRSRARLT